MSESTFAGSVAVELNRTKIIKKNRELIPYFEISSIMGIIFVVIFITSNIPYDHEYGNFGTATAIISGYTVTLMSLICIFLLSPTFDYKNLSSSYTIVGVLTIIMIVYNTWTNILHFNKINRRKLPIKYNTYRGWSIFLIFVQQIYLIYGVRVHYGSPPPAFSILMLIITLLNIWFLLIQSIILDKFSVDVI